MRSPFPYFGGKSPVASVIWQALDPDSQVYIEPFCGSAAVLLARPGGPSGIEIINDADGFVANFWRAVAWDPDAVAYWATWPMSEVDLHARTGWLLNRSERLKWLLEDPDFYDPKIAGWWLWGRCCSIARWLNGEGPWFSTGVHLLNKNDVGKVDLPGFTRSKPCITRDMGIFRKTQAGQTRDEYIRQLMIELHNRLKDVKILCGDWKRAFVKCLLDQKTCAIFLDPPYSANTGRDIGLYTAESTDVSAEVRRWAIEHGERENIRVVLAGYEGEHDMPESWRVYKWAANGGYGNQRRNGDNMNKLKERLWFSPHCHHVDANMF